jgi:hypothetical protein
MLTDQNIMDYSLLVTVCIGEVIVRPHYAYRSTSRGCVYLIAMIDILQEYNWVKRVETFVKAKIRRIPLLSFSAVEPRLYSQRLLEFLKQIL